MTPGTTHSGGIMLATPLLRSSSAPSLMSRLSQLVPGDEDKPVVEKGFIATYVDHFGNMSSQEATCKVVEALRETGVAAEHTTHWRLRDWLITAVSDTGVRLYQLFTVAPADPLPCPRRIFLWNYLLYLIIASTLPKGNPLAEDEEWKKTPCPKMWCTS